MSGLLYSSTVLFTVVSAKLDKLDFDINELVCPRLVFQEEICWLMAFGHTIKCSLKSSLCFRFECVFALQVATTV